MKIAGNSLMTVEVQNLGFSQVFRQDERFVGQNINIDLQLTEVINSTSPLVINDDYNYIQCSVDRQI